MHPALILTVLITNHIFIINFLFVFYSIFLCMLVISIPISNNFLIELLIKNPGFSFNETFAAIQDMVIVGLFLYFGFNGLSFLYFGIGICLQIFAAKLEAIKAYFECLQKRKR